MEYSLIDLLDFGRQLEQQQGRADAENVSVTLAQKLLRIRDRSGHESVLQPNRVQLAYERTRGRCNVVVKARQMGMTTWIAGRFFLKTITAPGVLTVQVAHTREAAESIFRMVQRFWECLPEETRKGPLKRSRANVGQMVFPELDSEFRVLTAADANAGRGLTIQNMHCSEVSRWPGDAAETLAGLRAAVVPGGEIVLESTPNGACGCFYQEWKQAAEKGVVQHFFPWWMEEAYVAEPVTDPDEEEQTLMLAHGLTPQQIGFRRGLVASYGAMHIQEFAEDAELCFRTSGECYFDVDGLERCLANAAAPVESQHRGALQVWLPPEPGREYIVTLDPAGGGSEGDYAAVQVIERASGMQCAEVQRRLAPRDAAREAARLGRLYGGAQGEALLAVERNNHGHSAIAHLQLVEKYTNLYQQNGQLGWLTTQVSKAEGLSLLQSLLTNRAAGFRSRRLLEECRTLVTRPNGSTGAAGGAHDDCVMAMAIAQAVRAEAQPGRRSHGIPD